MKSWNVACFEVDLKMFKVSLLMLESLKLQYWLTNAQSFSVDPWKLHFWLTNDQSFSVDPWKLKVSLLTDKFSKLFYKSSKIFYFIFYFLYFLYFLQIENDSLKASLDKSFYLNLLFCIVFRTSRTQKQVEVWKKLTAKFEFPVNKILSKALFPLFKIPILCVWDRTMQSRKCVAQLS